MTTREPTPIDRIADAWVDTQVALEPERRVELGLPGDQSEYGDFSPASFEAHEAAMRSVLRELDATAPVDQVDEVTALELRRDLGLRLEMIEAQLGFRDVNNIASPAQSIRMVFDLMPRETAADLDDIARRLAAVPAAIDGYVETIREGARRGVVPSRRPVLEAIAQARAYAAQGGFFDGLAASTPAGGAVDALTADLERGAAAARGAYETLVEALETDLVPVATERDGVGRELYSLASRAFLGATIDLDETYEWGLDELARTADEQAAVAREIVPGGSLADAVEALDADPSRTYHDPDAFREWMQRTSDEAIEALAGVHFDIPEPMRRLECRIAPTHEGVIYYTGPSDDFSRPGRMWWSVTPDQTTFATWRERTTVYHEGVPGHHLQIARAVYLKDELNAWRRDNWTSGHGEGWALYAERLMADLGFLDDPGDRLGMLDGQRMRAARVALDIGLHLGKTVPQGDRAWDYDYALAFLGGNAKGAAGFIRFEVNRYVGWPGQAPAYKVGQRIWEQVRDRARADAGASFDLRAWHTRALGLGGLGLDTLETVLARPA